MDVTAAWHGRFTGGSKRSRAWPCAAHRLLGWWQGSVILLSYSPCTVRLVGINWVQSQVGMELNVQIVLWQPYLFVSLLLPFLFSKAQWLRAVVAPAGSKPGPTLGSKAAFRKTSLSSPFCRVSVCGSIL